MPKTQPEQPVLEPTPDPRMTIHDAVLEIYRDGKLYAQKANRNAQQSYNYVSEADFLALLRPQLAAYGVIVSPSYEVLNQGELTTKSGSVMRTITLVGTFRFTHAASQTWVEVVTIGEGTDQQDKAPYKAMTGALKYAMRQLFLVETGDDPEKDDVQHEHKPEPPPEKSRFVLDFEEQVTRLKANNVAGLKRVLKPFALDFETVSDVTLNAIPGPTKREIIAALKAEPPF